MINKDKFLFLYQNEYGQLKQKQIDGLTNLLILLDADTDMQDIRYQAYALATVKHECAGTWNPIAEYGKGKGLKYGIPDEKTGQIYYGRGYVQLTWKDNYATMSKVCGADFVTHPDLTMKPEYAYRILSYGMRKGSFTGKKLADYLNSERTDYIQARRIINGLDMANKIASYAEQIELMLKASQIQEETI